MGDNYLISGSYNREVYKMFMDRAFGHPLPGETYFSILNTATFYTEDPPCLQRYPTDNGVLYSPLGTFRSWYRDSMTMHDNTGIHFIIRP